MWDLAFLIGADRDLPEREVEETIAAYAASAPLDRARLDRFHGGWRDFWRVRDEARRRAQDPQPQGRSSTR